MEDHNGNPITPDEFMIERIKANQAAAIELITLYQSGSDKSVSFFKDSRAMYQDRITELYKAVILNDEDSLDPEIIGVTGCIVGITGALLDTVTEMMNKLTFDEDTEDALTSAQLLANIARIMISHEPN